MIEYTGVMEAIEICDKELNVVESRIDAGEDVLDLCKEQMRNLKRKKEFYQKSKNLLIAGKYHEFEILCNTLNP